MNRLALRTTLSATSGYLTGMLSTWLQPVVVASLHASYDFSPAMMGATVAVDAGACATVAIVLGLAARRFVMPYRWIGLAGVIAATAANLLCSVVVAVVPIILLRLAAGVGEGMALCAATATLGASVEPDRRIAQVMFLTSLFASCALMLAPVFHVVGNAPHTFFFLGGVTAAIGVWVVFLPAVTSPAKARRASAPTGAKTIIVLLGGILLGISSSMVWAFSSMLGQKAGLSLSAVAIVISVAAYFGMVGSGVAGLLGTRYGRICPAAVAVLIECTAFVVFLAAGLPSTFVIGICTMLLVGMFIRPFMMGITAAIDPSGGLTASMSGTLRLGGFLGPLIGGSVIQLTDDPRIVAVGQVLLLPSILFLFWAVSRRSSDFPAVAAPGEKSLEGQGQ